MTAAITLVRLLPTRLVARVALAAVEVGVAAAILSGSIVIGHELREWRAWYWAPAMTHPWAPTSTPSAFPLSEPGRP
ncbi:MAG TPA: hypothetical protein VFC31_06410 [Candidatus Limnocylindria bacterium]|nr:hypothetical protein [Candidatus Limnocylindria bacterium]